MKLCSFHIQLNFQIAVNLYKFEMCKFESFPECELNGIPFVHNQKEYCHYNHIPFSLR